ncbi:peptidylprolyl isomerase [Pseudohaliea rubra]|uniref:Chaperone SurA n=1 Tax=Pseudohaliea rubra DSM 19751 TaxID=1265313 RepID=A0A095XT68_9GAMM|nr:peptidylprolyl isomerase [Pseudohaliea rubra]KGE02861.1 Survival protein SurA precursor (Peptidyl-prolyl cis-trans isomerase SurA) [Pseudohaliea rubra DSM 19751]
MTVISNTLRTLAGALVGPGLLAALLATTAAAETEMLDQVVAIVDDDVIMASELRERVETVTGNLEARGMELPPEDVLISETLDRLILDSIQMQMGERFGVRIPDAQLDAAMQRVAAQNGLSLEQFRLALEQQGRSYRAMRDNIRQEMVIQRVQMGNVNQRVEISDQEVKNFMTTEEGEKLIQPEYRIVHALLPVAEAAPEREAEASREQAETLAARIQAGESFQTVISEANETIPMSGGDLGWRKLDDLPSLFQDVAPSLTPGELADVFRSPSGFHLVYLADARGVGGETVSQTHARHILIKPTEILSDEKARELAAQLKARIEGGEDFSALAREYSEDIGTAAEGGDLGWSNPGQMVPAFENTMASTPLGEISDPVRTEFGWHIIEVLDRREKDMTEEVRVARVTEFLHQRKYDEELDAWLRKIRDEAFVDIK